MPRSIQGQPAAPPAARRDNRNSSRLPCEDGRCGGWPSEDLHVSEARSAVHAKDTRFGVRALSITCWPAASNGPLPAARAPTCRSRPSPAARDGRSWYRSAASSAAITGGQPGCACARRPGPMPARLEPIYRASLSTAPHLQASSSWFSEEAPDAAGDIKRASTAGGPMRPRYPRSSGLVHSGTGMKRLRFTSSSASASPRIA